MVWKESYRLGVERIDNQHMELFRMTENLIKAIAVNAPVEVYKETIDFLKEYVIYHFHDEEEYQASINYSGLDAHREEHIGFTETVLEYETKLINSNFDMHILKDLAGTVAAWLIYHVADTDQKIVAGPSVQAPGSFALNVSLFSDSVVEVMKTIAGFDRDAIRQEPVSDRRLQGDIFVEVKLFGKLEGSILFGFSKELALNLGHTMSMMHLTEVDGLVISALCQLANISCTNAADKLSLQGIFCNIQSAVVKDAVACNISPITGMRIETGIGRLEVAMLLKKQAKPRES